MKSPSVLVVQWTERADRETIGGSEVLAMTKTAIGLALLVTLAAACSEDAARTTYAIYWQCSDMDCGEHRACLEVPALGEDADAFEATLIPTLAEGDHTLAGEVEVSATWDGTSLATEAFDVYWTAEGLPLGSVTLGPLMRVVAPELGIDGVNGRGVFTDTGGVSHPLSVGGEPTEGVCP